QFTCLLALLPALALGCASSSREEAPDSAYADAVAHEEAKPYDGGAAPSMDYDYAEDMVAAPADEAASPSAPPAPMAEAEAPGFAGADGEGAMGIGTTAAPAERSASGAPAKAKASSSSRADKKGGRIARDEESKPAKI